MRRRALTAWACLAILALWVGSSRAASLATRYDARLDIPPRLQWNANQGYCGEVSFISAGLFFGQYLSQYTARALASPGVPQRRRSSQLLLGVNDLEAARAMRLEAVPWDSGRDDASRDFLAWVKAQVLLGHPTIIGVYTNENLFYGKTDPDAGEPDYDHIVPVTGIGSDWPLDSGSLAFHASDVIRFSDNGLWAPDDDPVYRFAYRFGPFRKTRAAANDPDGSIYSLAKVGRSYGVAITGVADRDGVTIPVRVKTSVDSEIPEMRNRSDARPPPMSLELTALVTIPDRSQAYRLYLYDDFAKVPDAGFNQHADRAVRVWEIPPGSGLRFEATISILSSQVAVFRAVPASAP